MNPFNWLHSLGYWIDRTFRTPANRRFNGAPHKTVRTTRHRQPMPTQPRTYAVRGDRRRL